VLLILDDDRELVGTLADGCRLLGVACLGAHSLADLVRHLAAALRCDRALIDLELGDGTGLEAARRLRRHGFAGPIHFMTNHGPNHPLVDAAERMNGATVSHKPILIRDLEAIIS
jgi:DNA-binding response OmpR family regulator